MKYAFKACFTDSENKKIGEEAVFFSDNPDPYSDKVRKAARGFLAARNRGTPGVVGNAKLIVVWPTDFGDADENQLSLLGE